MAQQVKVGLLAHSYINTSTSWTTPTWAAVDIIKDVTLDIAMGEADLSSRQSIWKLVNPTQLAASVEINFYWNTVDANYLLLQAGAIAGTDIDMAFMDTAIATSKAHGLRGHVGVFGWGRSEPIDGEVRGKATLKPTMNVDGNYPTWFTVA